MAGIAGPAGYAGARGAQGPTGATGAQGSTGVVSRWTTYREFWFENDRADMHQSDASKASEIAAYMNQNPSLQVGIDNSMDPRNAASGNQSLSDRRVSVVRDALVQAGVPNSRIDTGSFGNSSMRRDGRVEVLIVSRN